MYILGIDIGGTKCAVILGRTGEGPESMGTGGMGSAGIGSPGMGPGGTGVEILDREAFPTEVGKGVGHTLGEIYDKIGVILEKNKVSLQQVKRIGISCGGPLDSKRGIIMSPPNLIGWDDIHITELMREKYGIVARLQNDANACALAEWKFGAGRGFSNVVFLTFGTGMGAGLILDGNLYAGTTDMAGEVGHMRLDDFGPVGFGKAGSFEGFCSGGGIAQLARQKVLERLQMGESVSFCKGMDGLEALSARTVAEAAEAGDELALEIYRICGRYLGKGLSIIIDLLNPEVIVIGSIFARSGHLLSASAMEVIERETLVHSRKACRIVPAGLGEKIGDYAALSVALYERRGE